MADEVKPEVQTVEDMFIAQALAKMNKPPQVRTPAVLAELVKFANSGDKSSVKNGTNSYKFATRHKAARVIGIIRGNSLLQKKSVYAIDTDDYGTVLVNVSSATQ